MVTSFATKLILSKWRVEQRFRKKSSTIDIVEQFKRTQMVLVYVPATLDYFEPAVAAVRQIQAQRPDWQMTLVLRQQESKLLSKEFQPEIICYSEADFNVFGWPRESFRKHFRGRSFDLALDLTFHMDFLAVFLLKISEAQLRVCFNNPTKSHFCNLEIRINPLEAIDSKYQSLTKYIGMLAKPESSISKSMA